MQDSGYAKRMNSIAWMRGTVGDDTRNAVADHAGIVQSTLNRQIDKGVLRPETVVAIARAYGVPILPGLVACGLITEQEAAIKARSDSILEALAKADDADLVREVLHRIEQDGAALHTVLDEPLDATHPALRPVSGGAYDDLAADDEAVIPEEESELENETP